MSAEKTFKPAREENPALFAYDFDGLFTIGHTHNDVLGKAQSLSNAQYGDTDHWREFSAIAIKAYIADLEVALSENPKAVLRQYDTMLETLHLHAKNGDNLAIVTSNEFPEVVGTVLDFLAQQGGLEYLQDIPIIYGGLFKHGRDDIKYNEEHGYFRISKEEKEAAKGGKNAHIDKAMLLTGIKDYSQVAFIDDQRENTDLAYQIDEVIPALFFKPDTYPFHELILEASETLKIPASERVIISDLSESGSYASDEALGTPEDAGLEEEDIIEFEDDEQQNALGAVAHIVDVQDEIEKPDPVTITDEADNVGNARNFWQNMMQYQNATANKYTTRNK